MKTCIVTGASSGIGRAGAIEVSKLGEYDNIVLISRRLEELEKTKAMIHSGVSNECISFDVECVDKIP